MNNRETQANDKSDFSEPEQRAKQSFWQDFLTSLAFLSRLPIKPSGTTSGDYSLVSASRTFGITGLFLGSLTGLIFWLASTLGLTTLPAVLVALAISTLITGGLHEDGLADVADGFGGGWTKDRKLEIMRDSSIGTYGVLALVFSVGLRVTAYVLLLEANAGFFVIIAMFAALGCLSRAPLAFMMYQVPLARKDGRAVQAGSPCHDNLRQGLFVSVIAGAVLLILAIGIFATVAVLAGIFLAYLIIARLARIQVGGYTGDILGTLQQLAEISALLALLITR